MIASDSIRINTLITLMRTVIITTDAANAARFLSKMEFLMVFPLSPDELFEY